MADLTNRIEDLSPRKRQLLELFLQEQNTAWRAEAYVAPRSEVEAKLADIWSRILGIEKLGVNDNFFEIGGDSIQCIQIVAKARQAGLHMTTKQLFENPTITELASVIGASADTAVEHLPIMGPVPITPIQQWFFELNLTRPAYWNQAVMLESVHGDSALWEKACEEILRHHDALRLRFERVADHWLQVNAPFDHPAPFVHIDLSHLDEKQQVAASENGAAEFQESLNLSAGPLFKIILFTFGKDQPARLLIIAHHLVIDGISFRTLIEDLETVYLQLKRSEPVQLPPKTASFRQWAQSLTEYATSATALDELPYWRKQRKNPQPLPRDFSDGSNTEASARTLALTLTEEETRQLFRTVLAAYRAQINDVLLAALAESFSKQLSIQVLQIDLEGHGREELFKNVDVSRTLGWFTSVFPVQFDTTQARGITQVLQAVKDDLRAVPNRGIGFGILRYLNPDKEVVDSLRRLPRSELVFNYLGQFDATLSQSALFKRTNESPGPLYAPEGIRPYVIQIVGSVMDGRLEINWTYSASLHKPERIEALAQEFMSGLRVLISQQKVPETDRLLQSDFREAELSQDELDQLFQ
jgi:non-ribosomal peptide synthase protein (TIGR01720 family)